MSAPVIPPMRPAPRLRAWLGVEEQREVRMPLGGVMFDMVLTTAGQASQSVIAEPDRIQGGCGPVVEAPDQPLPTDEVPYA
ncbi:hypothetical protein [Streptomyces sp. NBC_01022]|uniref:hypothetical protein n=1 Tax=Streptomyces sp. NBC_01022 TaxID=2903723 RepID=UPI002DD7FF6F|nr:hypothetical protein [Streptomyces sp. NBC_01022]WRZ79457.1 hypothetical protein OG316_03855 [Streptomyces sp. NBC_01022]WRZ86219.1 hypothetical protein OG316_41040 [Streptomyces sp. NBC_01022]